MVILTLYFYISVWFQCPKGQDFCCDDGLCVYEMLGVLICGSGSVFSVSDRLMESAHICGCSNTPDRGLSGETAHF